MPTVGVVEGLDGATRLIVSAAGPTVNPWTYAIALLFDDVRATMPGSIAAWRIAARHNATHPVGNTLWWHTSGATLSLWMRRHWSAEQIGATLMRDDLCR